MKTIMKDVRMCECNVNNVNNNINDGNHISTNRDEEDGDMKITLMYENA